MSVLLLRAAASLTRITAKRSLSTTLHGRYAAPALDAAHVAAYQAYFGGFVIELPLTLLYL